MALARLPPLALVECCIVRAAPSLHALGHVVDLLTSFLDLSRLLTPPKAASTGSLRLFERVMQRYEESMVGQAVRSFSCANALKAAIQKNDLAMVQKIHALHPEPLAVRSLMAAFKFGTVDMVQWIVDHRHDRLCCDAGVDNLCDKCFAPALEELGSLDTRRIVEWCYSHGLYDPMTAYTVDVRRTMGQSVEAFEWHVAQGVVEQYEANEVISVARTYKNENLASLLVCIL